MLDSLIYLCAHNRKSLTYLYRSQDEDKLNTFDDFGLFFLNVFNCREQDPIGLEVDPNIANQVFNETFSAVGEEVYGVMSAKAMEEMDELFPKKILKPVAVDPTGEPVEEPPEEIVQPTVVKSASQTSIKTVSKEDITDIHDAAGRPLRMVTFANSTEMLMVQKYSFRYILNPSLL